MIKIRELEKAVSNLPPEDFVLFRAWFHKFDAARWDKQFENDVATGKLDRLGQKAIEDFKKGNYKEL